MPDQLQKDYMRIVIEILPSTLGKLDQTIENREKYFSGLTVEQQDEMLGMSFFFSSAQLRAAEDALHTFQSLSHIADGSVELTITQNGVAGLLRQALEAIATYLWLNEFDTDEVARAKAHSYHVIDLQERLNYYKDLGDSKNHTKSHELLMEANKLGLEGGFIKAETNKYGDSILKPSYPLPGLTDLIGKVKTPGNLFTPELLSEYPGMQSAKWMYRWSSGLAHGKYWVTKYKTMADGSQRTVPNYFNLLGLLSTLIEQIGEILTSNTKYSS